MESARTPAYSSLVPMIPVTNVVATIGFYEQLGFKIGNTHTPDGSAEPVWAWLFCGDVNVMINQADKPLEASHESAALWLYCDDVSEMHELLRSRGLDVGEISYPFYSQKGEFHVHDPDGYAIFVTHTA